jgi:RimJ/RimL family protein N-acetyltransferase
MNQQAMPDTPDWERRWSIDAGSLVLRPVTRQLAQDIIDGGPAARAFAPGALHERIPQAMGFAIRDIESGAAAALPTVWVVIRRADEQIVGDLGTHGLPDDEGRVEIGYALAPSVRGQGVGTAAVAAFLGRLATVPAVRQVTAVTGADNTASRRLLERQQFQLDGPVPDTDQVRYTRNLR